MTVSINGRYSHDFKNGVLVKETLDPANETVNRGHYVATTLSTVDADLAVGNIKEATTIFGFLGTLAAGALAHDTEGHASKTAGGGTTGIKQDTTATGGNGTDTDIPDLSVTPTFNAISRAEAILAGAFAAKYVNTEKVRLYVGGVQQSESAYLSVSSGTYSTVALVYNGALSGAVIIKGVYHNYAGGESSYGYAGLGAILSVGSVKII